MESVCTQRGRETDRDRRVGGGGRERGKEGKREGGKGEGRERNKFSKKLTIVESR